MTQTPIPQATDQPGGPSLDPNAGPPPGAPPGAVHGAATAAPADGESGESGETGLATVRVTATDRPVPPALPAKFWDAGREAVRLDALVRSYLALEKRLSQRPGDAQAADAPHAAEAPASPGARVPDTPEQYCIDCAESWLDPDPEVNAVLHEAGFTEDQVQLVYDLAAEKIAPLVRSLAREAAGASDRARLEAHFGGPERWAEVRRQLKRWAENKLPPDAFQALSSSYEGVLALHRMMARKEEPTPLGDGDPEGDLTEEQLRRKMRDPRYWRDRDPKLQQQVAEGFRRLYPDRR